METGRNVDRYWLLTTTTYGSRLPGDSRGFVSPVRDERGRSVLHNKPGTPFDADMPALARAAELRLKGPAIYLDFEQAQALLSQFQETAGHRGWLLRAVGIMNNHVHVVLGVPGDPDPEDLLRDLKSYGSRALNRRWGRPASGTWWTESGSKRKLPTEEAVIAAIRYVRAQPDPLLIWVDGELLVPAPTARASPGAPGSAPCSG